MTLEERYEEEAMEAIEEVKRRSREVGDFYNPTRWQQKVRRMGAVAAAKDQLRTHLWRGATDGGRRLTDLGLDEFSVEVSVLNPENEDVFDREDRRLAFGVLLEILREHGERRRGALV